MTQVRTVFECIMFISPNMLTVYIFRYLIHLFDLCLDNEVTVPGVAD